MSTIHDPNDTSIDESGADIDAVDERLWELYVMDCDNRGLKASIKDYLIWLEENYE